MQLKKRLRAFSSRRVLVLLLPLSLAVVVALWALYATPSDGPWTGTTNLGQPMSFTVSGDGTQWSDFKLKTDLYCEHYGVSATTEFTTAGPGTITDGQFSFSGGGYAFTGAFDTPTTASGTYTLTDYSWVISLPPPIYVHIHYVNQSGTWTATFNGTLPSITVTSPNGGESWAAGSAHNITWSTTGTIANVKIEYSINGGSDWISVIETTSNLGSYAWTVPGPASTSCLVRVSDAAAPGVFDISDAVFSIIQAIPSSERQALIDLYNSTNGGSWANNSGWKTPPLDVDGFAMPGTEGTWFGVTVNSETHAVTGINLDYNNLAGSLPAELASLTSLQYLSFRQNALTGPIPAALGTITSLRQFYLTSNQLSGGIPATLGSLVNLQELHLDINPLGGTIPPELGSLTNLTYLRINDDYLTGSIPPELGSLTNLQNLGLDANQLTGSIPPELGQLTNLTMFLLYRNQLSGSIPAELGNLASLRSLVFSGNQLSGSIPAELGNLTNLQEIYLTSNQMSGSIPPELGNLPQLRVLRLGSNQLSGSIPAVLGNLSNLQGLELQANQLSGPIPVELGNLANLIDLQLDSNQLTGSIPSELGNLVHLGWIKLNGNQLTGPIPSILVNLTALYDSFSDIGYNALYTSNEALITFLNSKDPDWASTQTIAPAGVTATAVDGANILVSWLPIPYSGDVGYYKVYSSQIAGGPYTLAGQTADKTVSSVEVNGLTPGQTYYFVVQTHTDAHGSNLNVVESENSPEASATAWTQVQIRIAGTVTLGGSPLTNVVMAGLPSNPLTDGAGGYEVTVDAGWSGTVTPTLEGYTFDPAFRTYTTLTGDQLSQDYTATVFVTPTITVTSPNGGETWAPGSTHNITWAWTGEIANVKIEYSINGGTGWATLVESTTNSGTYSWNVPGPASSSCLVRVSDAANPGIQDTCDAVFSITSIQSSERQALIGLYNSTNGDAWVINSGWKTPPLDVDGFALPGTEGTWFGVTVDSGTQRVAAISLQHNNLSGSIPAELGNLTNLQQLNLLYNGLSGSIPAELGALADLRTLVLSWNQLSGSIPAWLGSLASLQELHLDSNPLGGSLPAELGNLTNLTYLRLNNDQLTGPIPPELGNLISLQYLGLDSNQMSGSIPVMLGNLANLQQLDLSSNQLSGPIPAEFGDLADLRVFHAHLNQLSGSIPAELGNLTNLEELFLYNNQLNGVIPAELGNSSNLIDLNLSSNQLSGPIPASLGNLVNLRLLNLAMNPFSGSIPAELGNLASLQELRLDYAGLSGSIPPELGDLANLLWLTLPGNQLSGSIPPELGDLTNLQGLALSSNQLSGSIPAELGNLASLQWLYLSSSQLSGSIPPELGNLANLNWLGLQGNQLSGSIPAELGNLANLGMFRLDSNQLSGSIPAELGGLHNLGGLYLTSNQLSGPIPPELGSLSSLSVLQIGVNQLSGSIPAELGDLANLGYLDLNSNQLSGSIPAELGNLTNLRSLDLRSNQLSGSIPSVLGSLANLQALHLNSNQLSGPIPIELGNLTNLQHFTLLSNQLSGSIPAELGNLTNLRDLYLGSNKLSGSIPAELCSLTNLTSLILGYNGLTATDPDLLAFLSLKDPSWASTQTVMPTDLAATAAGGTTILVSWTPILYQGDTGGYIVSTSTTSGGPYTVVGQTATKSVSSMTISGLTPGQPYYFVVRTHTDAHAQNLNVLESEDSAEAATATYAQLLVTGTVLTGGSPLPNVVMSGLSGNPVTDPSGVYQGLVNVGWSGTVTPTLSGYVFTPVSRSYTGLSLDQWNQDYEGGPPTGTITVGSPNGWETLAAGSTHDITWSWTGPIANVKIEYSIDNGTGWMTVIETTPNSGSYAWTVPGPASMACLVRVSDAASPGINDQSDATFRIVIRKDFVGTWDGQGVYYRNSDTGAFVKLASPATMIATGDLDGDGIDDLIGLWPSQGGIWVKYSQTGAWAKLSSTAVHIAAGDMNGDGRVDLLGTWDGQGVYYRNSMTGTWVKLASPATMITTGDLDGDKTDDLVGIWPSQGGVWVKYSKTGLWARLSSTARDIAAGDMNGDGRDDLLATWDGQGVYYRNSMTGAWVKMASQADQVTCGDLDADGTDDLLGIWPTQGGVWVKYSKTGAWALLGSTARDITAGKMRAAEGGVTAPPEAGVVQEAAADGAAAKAAIELPLPMGGTEEGPGIALNKRDFSDKGPGGARFVYLEEKNLVPMADRASELTRIPGPGEPGFVWGEQKNMHPGEVVREKRDSTLEKRGKKHAR